VLDAVCGWKNVALVVNAVAGGTIISDYNVVPDVLFLLKDVNELLGVGGGILLMLVG
jgi:hypothetical protein